MENSVDDKHWVAIATLGVLDRTPSRRDDVAFHCRQARASGVQIPSVTEDQSEYGDRHAGAECRNERWLHDLPSLAKYLASPQAL
jgi:hypothetical protein